MKRGKVFVEAAPLSMPPVQSVVVVVAAAQHSWLSSVSLQGRRKSAIIHIRDQLLEAGGALSRRLLLTHKSAVGIHEGCVPESFTGCQARWALKEGSSFG